MYYRSNNIVVYLSPDYEGKLLLQHSLFFQQTLGMRVFICSINEKPPLLKFFFTKKQLKEKITPEKLREFTKSTIPAKALEHFSFRVKSGKRLPLLIRQSKKGGYEFLVVDKSNSKSALNIGELDKLIGHSYCPVMAIHKNHPITKIKKIVIPVDVTQSTKKKLLWATYFAKKYQARIIIVSALTLNLDIKRSLVYKNSEKIKSILSKRGIECEVQILHTPGQKKHEVILNFIQEENPDMVIIRTHQESNLKNTRIGNFVSELVHSCKIPVFTVNSFIPAIPDDFVHRL
ncbi:universal stress protein [Mariniphaga sp.]|uniref:universal stress protein n=1 Tax=Mariniphaga sp. TaxID=1954475 RepID=UPI0035631E1C